MAEPCLSSVGDDAPEDMPLRDGSPSRERDCLRTTPLSLLSFTEPSHVQSDDSLRLAFVKEEPEDGFLNSSPFLNDGQCRSTLSLPPCHFGRLHTGSVAIFECKLTHIQSRQVLIVSCPHGKNTSSTGKLSSSSRNLLSPLRTQVNGVDFKRHSYSRSTLRPNTAAWKLRRRSEGQAAVSNASPTVDVPPPRSWEPV